MVISITYVVVVISIVAQGLTIEPLLRRLIPKVSAETAAVAREEATGAEQAAA
jgi:NhaP-type Na+/H+ or K+/H+ antiporter